MTTFNLRNLRLRSGEQLADAKDVELVPLELGGQRYVPIPATATAQLSVTRASTGMVFELEFEARLHGPCTRASNASSKTVPVVARVIESCAGTVAGTGR